MRPTDGGGPVATSLGVDDLSTVVTLREHRRPALPTVADQMTVPRERLPAEGTATEGVGDGMFAGHTPMTDPPMLCYQTPNPLATGGDTPDVGS